MIKQKLHVRKTARFFISGNPGKSVTDLWFVLHGYGQSAEKFLEKFAVLVNDNTCIVAPEALNRYYTDGTSGRVGASWMTSDDREDEIEDYVRFLDDVLKEVSANAHMTHARVHILGFSQGAATAARWVAMGSVNPCEVIFWGGLFPPDMNWNLSEDKWKKIPVRVLIGDQDEYYTSEKFRDYFKPLEGRFETMTFKTYHGRHTIYPEILRELNAIG